MNQTREGYYTVTQVAERTGLTYRQIEYWIHTGTIQPSILPKGSGTRTLCSESDMVRLERIAELHTHAKRLGLQPEVSFIQLMWEATDPVDGYDTIQVGRIQIQIQDD